MPSGVLHLALSRSMFALPATHHSSVHYAYTVGQYWWVNGVPHADEGNHHRLLQATGSPGCCCVGESAASARGAMRGYSMSKGSTALSHSSAQARCQQGTLDAFLWLLTSAGTLSCPGWLTLRSHHVEDHGCAGRAASAAMLMSFRYWRD
jgi:hypothetical protein